MHACSLESHQFQGPSAIHLLVNHKSRKTQSARHLLPLSLRSLSRSPLYPLLLVFSSHLFFSFPDVLPTPHFSICPRLPSFPLLCCDPLIRQTTRIQTISVSVLLCTWVTRPPYTHCCTDSVFFFIFWTSGCTLWIVFLITTKRHVCIFRTYRGFFTLQNKGHEPLRSLKKAGELDMQCTGEGGAVYLFWGWGKVGQESEQMADWAATPPLLLFLSSPPPTLILHIAAQWVMEQGQLTTKQGGGPLRIHSPTPKCVRVRALYTSYFPEGYTHTHTRTHTHPTSCVRSFITDARDRCEEAQRLSVKHTHV